jgi:hypothetical protein
MVDGINSGINECVPCLKPSSSGSTSRSLTGLVIVPAILLYYLFRHSASLTEVSEPKVSLN